MRIAALAVLASAVLTTTLHARAADDPLSGQLSRLAQRRVLFGHQSVGAGIVAELDRLASPSGMLRVVEAKGATPLAQGTFGHAFVGKNGDPGGKLTAFKQLLAEHAAKPPDVALMKFCYVDIDTRTDVTALFTAYVETFRELERLYPHTTFVHVTAPLTTVQGGAKAFVKRLLGRAPSRFAENLRREEYNALLRARYGSAVFDLARLEATGRDGRVVTASGSGRSVLALRSADTRDGKHPDPAASERIARALVAQLAALP